MDENDKATERNERCVIASAADYAIPIEDVAGLLSGLDDEPPRPRIRTVSEEMMLLVAGAQDE